MNEPSERDPSEAPQSPATLPEHGAAVYVVATPIGHLDDLSPRAIAVMRQVSLLLCEDTRHTAKLCGRFGIGTRRVSLHAHNEERRTASVLQRLAAGQSVALVSDAGTPLVSDPGTALVRAAIAAGYPVHPVPGPSAVLAALVVSGFSARPFTFVGFLPRKGRARREWLAWLRGQPGTLVLFESPARLADTLRDLCAALGPRPVAIARELTKRFEQVTRGTLEHVELGDPRGEVTLVIAGSGELPSEEAAMDDAAIDAFIAEQRAQGMSSRDVARALAERSGLARGAAYRRVLGS